MDAKAVGEACGCRLHLGSSLSCKALLAVGIPELAQLPGSAGLNNRGRHVLCGIASCLGFLQIRSAQGHQQWQMSEAESSLQQKSASRIARGEACWMCRLTVSESAGSR